MAKFVVYKGFFQYDAVNLFAEELGAGLTKLGHNVGFIDGRSPTLNEDIVKILTPSVDYAISFNGAGSGYELMKTNTDSIYERHDIKFIAVLLDHPSHHLPRLNGKNTYITSYDHSHIDYLGNLFNHSKKIGFLPHGGSLSPRHQDKPYREREIPILFAGTFLNPNQALTELRRISQPIIRKLMLESIEPLVSRDRRPMEHVIANVAKRYGINLLEDLTTYHQFTSYLKLLDVFLKAHKRLLTLTKLDENNIPVTIYGNHWPRQQFRNHQLFPATDYRNILDLMTNSKIVLNMGYVPDGSHERVFSAALNGAVVLSDANPYFKTVFRDAILLYRFSELERLSLMLTRYLNDTERLATISENGKALSQEHTWQNRAEELWELIQTDWEI